MEAWKNWEANPAKKFGEKFLVLKNILFFSFVFLVLGQVAVYLQEFAPAQAKVQSYPLQQQPPYTVALDAGHGGYDTGANCGNIQEVKIIEKTVDELFLLLQNNPAFRPIRTRENGEGSSISKRAEKATQEKASLLLSVHMNFDPSTAQSHGFECFPIPPGRTWSDQSMNFAKAVAQQMGLKGHRLRGSNGIRFAYYSGNKKLIVDAEDTKQRTLKSFGILEKVECPAVLVEQCFISNSEDRKNWTTEEGCKNAAQAYYYAICEYFAIDPNQKPEPPKPPVFEFWKK